MYLRYDVNVDVFFTFSNRLVQATARVACDIRHTSLMKKEVTEDGNEDASKSETADDKENEKCERDTDPTSSSAVSLWMRYPPC